ncbi:Protein of unknown function [Humidesulfovibrio mexicanus]|uniref:DUF3313 domain-containing protein n=1 Tax=Humidesulfovibrio mexicanus TaxID=147047 RepID=A0A238ZX21_9BACT|nr:DUF3313 domain-containing protein [Humidesulfovibrio mexicanus]SNR87947.1 Protein of unknown function [Humidesulfovibrio mexicanus]
MRTMARLALPALLLLLCACAAKDPAPADPNQTPEQAAAAQHFLGAEYAKMTQVPGHPERFAWRKPGIDPKHYNAVLLDKTVIWRMDELAKESGVKPEELTALAQHFDGVLVKTMQSIDFPLAAYPQPRVLRISAAVTQVKASNPTRNTISSVLPVGILITLGRKAAGSSDPNVGSCTMEFRFSDAQTGESIALFADHKDGDKYDSANFQALGQAEKAMDQWAEALREGILKNWGVRKE